MKRLPIWSEEEKNTLRNIYPLGNKEEIMKKLPNRTWKSIESRASVLRIRLNDNPRRRHKIQNLLQDTHEAYYWMGFIAADGNFCSKGSSVAFSVALAIKDIIHLEKLATYIKANLCIQNKGKTCKISASGESVVKPIMDKFDLRERKTYNPPKTISWMKPKLALSFIIGFIDGDGCIRNKNGGNAIVIKVYHTWIKIFEEFKQLLVQEFRIDTPSPYLTEINKTTINICKKELLFSIKKHVIEHNLPVLNRKWDIIN